MRNVFLKTPSLWLFVAWVLGFGVAAWGQLPAPEPSVGTDLDARLTEQWTAVVRPGLLEHCGGCHMNGETEGGVGLDDYDSLEKIRDHESTWEQIRGVIRAEAMPPPDSSTITIEQRQVLVAWIESVLHDVDCGCPPPLPEVTLRRLNQAEYDNTIRDLLGRDLLGLDVRPSKQIGFVSDDVGNGFDNQGEVLTLPPIAMEKYLQAAAWIAERTIATDREKFRKQSFDGEDLGYDQRLNIPIYVAAGKYSLTIRGRFGDDQQDSCKARLLLDDAVIHEWEVPPRDESLKYDLQCDSGDHVLSIEYFDDFAPATRNAPNRRLKIESVRLAGPAEGLPFFPKPHDRVVIAYPTDKDSPETPEIGFEEAARRVFAPLMMRAYRRPVSQEELQSVLTLCLRANEAGFKYLESLRFGLQAVLVSPQFLYRGEAVVASVGGERRIDNYAVANRLSYFLWSSMPDEELFSLAARGGLGDSATLKAQIERMLLDDKADALLSGFFGQWLGLRNLNKLDVDEAKFPFWSDRLRAAMIRETELFCQAMVREGKVSDLLLADYTFVNPRLAEFYGVPFGDRDPSDMYRRRPGRRGNDSKRQGLYEDEDKWIRVSLPENRRGIMTQASALALTSNPTRSSPVKRGKWVLEAILGDPPPSAPPNVPSLELAKAAENATLRERLEIHRENASCAGCHKLMDPIGLGLENFDAIGRWRDRDGNFEIDPQGELSDGRGFSGPSELVTILGEREDSVAKNFTQRLLTYALGRGLQRADRCDVDKILEQSKANGYTIRSIVEGVVLSDAFLQRSRVSTASSSQASLQSHE